LNKGLSDLYGLVVESWLIRTVQVSDQSYGSNAFASKNPKVVVDTMCNMCLMTVKGKMFFFLLRWLMSPTDGEG